MGNEGTWVLAEGFNSFLGNVLHKEGWPSEGRIAMLRLLGYGAEQDDIVLIRSRQERPPHHELHTQDRPTAHRRTGGGCSSLLQPLRDRLCLRVASLHFRVGRAWGGHPPLQHQSHHQGGSERSARGNLQGSKFSVAWEPSPNSAPSTERCRNWLR